MRQERR